MISQAAEYNWGLKGRDFGAKTAWLGILALKLLVPQFPLLENGDSNRTYL